MTRAASQSKRVGVLRMSFRARNVFGTFEERAPGPSCSKLGECYPVDKYYNQNLSSHSVDSAPPIPPSEQMDPDVDLTQAGLMLKYKKSLNVLFSANHVRATGSK